MGEPVARQRAGGAFIWLAAPLALLAVNYLIAERLFRVEYSGYLESNQGQFIAIAQGVARHWGDLRWWPEWDGGLPFQNTYLPLLPVTTGVFSLLTGHSAALSFHEITAALFCISPVMVYLMGLVITRKPGASFLAAVFYSVFSPCALAPSIRNDLGGLWNSRRLQILARYGEGPHIACLAFLPLAILFLYLAITRRKLHQQILAGVFVAATVLSNAFGGVILACACIALLSTCHTQRFWRNVLVLGSIAVLTYAWISPAAPPSVLAAIRANAPTIEGHYEFTLRSMAGVAVLAIGFCMLLFAARRSRIPDYLRFFLLYGWLVGGIFWMGSLARVYVVPQPHRYQIAMDMAVCILAVFGVAWLLERAPRRVAAGVAVIFVIALGIQARQAVHYARHFIRSVDITQTAGYRVSKWLERNMGGARAMVGGSFSFDFNHLVNSPQMHGGQEPMLPGITMRIAVFAIYSGMNAGTRDGENAILWLKALGAHAVSVPGPASEEFYKPFANPLKFDGLLPVLWREGGDTIYEVPARSNTLAHVMREADVVHTPPVDGLDLGQVEAYVSAMESPEFPVAEWRWTSRHSAMVRAQVEPGQAISAQVTYHPGWRAFAGPVEQRLTRDGLGFLTIHPTCRDCEIAVTYDGGPEWRLTCAASVCSMLTVAALCVLRKRRRSA